MDLRQLRYFVAVAEEASFTRASARVNIGQPPLSLQIKALENELGVRLFERSRHGVAPTLAGANLLRNAYEILAKVADAVATTQRTAVGEMGVVRIGFSSDVPLAATFRVGVRDHRRAKPDVRLELDSLTAHTQVEGLMAERIDVGFMRSSRLRRLPGKIASVTILEDRLAAVLPADHRFCDGEGALPVEALRQEPFVFFPPGVGTHDHVLALCARQGFAPNVVQVLRDSASIISLVEAGLGVTIVPAVFAARSTAAVVFRDLAEADAASDIVMTWRACERSPQVLGFVELMRRIRAAQSAGAIGEAS